MKRKNKSQLGVSSVEYGLALAVIVTMVMGGAKLMGTSLEEMFKCAGDKIVELVGGASNGSCSSSEQKSGGGTSNNTNNNNTNSTTTKGLNIDPSIAQKYPKAAKFIQQLKANNQKEYNAFKKYGQASKKTVDDAFSGKDLVVNMGQLNGAYGEFQPGIGSKEILIDEKVLKAYEQGKSGSSILLEATVKHEMTHYFDDLDGVDYPGEEGEQFEIDVYGQIIY